MVSSAEIPSKKASTPPTARPELDRSIAAVRDKAPQVCALVAPGQERPFARDAASLGGRCAGLGEIWFGGEGARYWNPIGGRGMARRSDGNGSQRPFARRSDRPKSPSPGARFPAPERAPGPTDGWKSRSFPPADTMRPCSVGFAAPCSWNEA